MAQHAMRDAHPLVGCAVGEPQLEPGEAIVLCAARLIVGRCIELRELVDLYDALLDRLRPAEDDDEITFDAPSRSALRGPSITSIDALVFLDQDTVDFCDHAHSTRLSQCAA